MKKKKTLLSFMAAATTVYGFWNVVKGISQETSIDVLVVLLGLAMFFVF